MSLADFVIESFGGYEKAKAVLDIPNAHFLHNIEGLKQRLLEYRHQHNIFEEGDPVVMRGTSHYDICEFVEASTVLPMYMLKDENGCKFGINKKCVDHATNEEIKAGKRLEASPIDSDIDKQVNLMDQFIADGGFDKAFADVFGLPESVVQSLKEVS